MDLGSVLPEAREVCQRLTQAGYEAYLVGGCVRDSLSLRIAKDWDVATSAEPYQVQRLFRHTIPTGIQHGTVTVLIHRIPIEVTTFRGEGAYSDARRPDSVIFGVPLEEDLSRRDFTVNAIALDPVTGRIVDPFGGQKDIEARVIRAVGDPLARFREDGLRVLRAVRFMSTLEFGIDRATEAAIPLALDALAKVSSERVKEELLKLLAARQPSVALAAAERTGILGVILPELVEGVGVTQNRHHVYDVWRHTLASVDGTPPDPIVRMGALLHDVAKPRTAAPKADSPGENTFYRHDAIGADMSDAILRRLKFSNRDRERIVAMVANHMFWYTPEWSDATVRRFLRRVSTDGVSDLFALRQGDVIGRGRGEDPETELGELRQRIDRVLKDEQALSVSDLAVTGQDVMEALGTGPGRIVGEVLRVLLEKVLEDPTQNQKELLLAQIPELAERIKAHGSV